MTHAGWSEQLFQGHIRFGIHSGQQHCSFEDYLDLWQRAEAWGYEWASTFDHFLPIFSDPEGPCFDGLTMLSAMAAHTSRLRCGILVVGVTYRHPAVLANIAATIDHISGGRLELGIGAAWYAMEHDEYGIPFPPIGRRIQMLREAMTILDGLWTQHRTSFKGRFFELQDALCEPKPVQKPRIPLWIGGSGEKLTLRVVAESADGWNTFFSPVDAYRHKLNALAAHCRDVGRDPGTVRKSLVVQAMVGETEREVAEAVRHNAQSRNLPLESARERGIVGTPEQCVEQLMPYVDLGVSDFIISARMPPDLRTLELVAQRVAPAVKERSEKLLARG